jgi:hypothetical protein
MDYVPSRSGCEPTPCHRPALPDGGRGISLLSQYQDATSTTDQRMLTKKKKEKQTKQRNVVPEMLQGLPAECTVIFRDFVFHHWIISLDTVSRGV